MKDIQVQLPYGPPPVLPDVEEQLKEYLLCPDRLPIHDYEKAQEFWPRQPDPSSLYHYELSPLGTTLKVDRDHTTGEVLQFREVPVDDIGSTAKNSMSLRRAPCLAKDAIRGTDSNYPFWPGGFPVPSILSSNEDQSIDVNFEDDLLYIAPGLKRGMRFKSDGFTPTDKDEPEEKIEEPSVEVLEEEPVEEKSPETEASPAPNLMDMLQEEENLLGLWKDTAVESEHKDAAKTVIQTMKVDIEDDLKVIPEKDNIPVLKISEAAPLKKRTKTEWAEVIDISTFPDDKLPSYPEKFTCNYELDTFQKHAILLLEHRSHVFVAAPTSAGKTIVAEYAIALSMERKSKTVYTSPIKALSNQKFHEFKQKWGQDVGLITGDVQINKTGSCLIMTTEILRSMLYQGSNVIQDIEFVIFDEVHYVNNVERGYVWEEVLILLPDSVVIVMLSATVPNTLEFANWVGRTKQKKMSVITIEKRPVPLEYYLYPATMKGKIKNSTILIMDSEKRFKEQGYMETKQALMEKSRDSYGSGGPMRPNEEKNMWIKIVRELEKKKLLPAVVFTLSRNRCDKNSLFLRGIDLTTKEEKMKINQLLERYLKRLKNHDEDLPQIQNMKSMLCEGIGVHHSGILPILKEIVERCFACKLVKLLFATETFAMGVNMPARTVLFDSIRKFDGQTQRTLQPAEFIQMAGRAGRRNEESVGTVLIICKKIPEIGELKTMMLGSPEKLKSQFRLTYSMILRLLRVETISVEYMMSRSFMEYYEQSQHVRYLKDIELTESKIAKLGALANQGGYAAHFSDLYDAASDYLDLLRDTKADARVMRDLFPGRILLICHKSHVNKLALLLKVECHRDLVDLIVLVLCNDEDLDFSSSNEIKLTVKPDLKQPVKERSNEWYKVLAIINQDKLFAPDASGAHTILTIPITDVIDITTKTLKVKTEIMMNDWNERQIPRFRDRPPGDTFSQTLQELTHLSLSHPDRKGLRFMHWQRNPRLSNREKQDELQEKIKAMKIKSIPNFEELFESVFEWKELERDLERLKFLQSDQSMALYGDYQNKVQVLRKLGYIDKNNAVDMKGRVAIKIRNHELLITELVLGNVLTNMPPEEIAALLSCMVFQQKVSKEPTLNYSLKKGVKIIKETNESIRLTERECGVQPSVDWMELNFNLVEVVYKWATDERFADIMKITEVQEGIIVRCIQQLNDILCDVKLAASIVGDTMLGDKMEEASRRIKREIVFAASLYTTDDI